MPDYDTLRTDRLVGQRMNAQHRAMLHRLHREPSVARTLSPTGEPLPAEKVDERFDHFLKHWQAHGYGQWMWFEKGSDAFVGRMGVNWTESTGEREMELAYAIMPGFWGQGLATEASTAVVDLAFHEIGVDELVLFTLEHNAGSRRVAEKLGFQETGTVMHAGLEHVLYRLKRDAWRKRQ
ncbi:MAG: GNAT family N-acetyltransferase [Phycisphaeraceae bacterium]